MKHLSSKFRAKLKRNQRCAQNREASTILSRDASDIINSVH